MFFGFENFLVEKLLNFFKEIFLFMEYLLLLAWEMKLEMFFILWKNNESLEDTSLYFHFFNLFFLYY